MNSTGIFTIGFTQSSAEDFFGRLAAAGVRRILDVRLNNRSQLAGFAKRDDLAFFARRIGHMDYRELTELAPTPELLQLYRSGEYTWDRYAKNYLSLLKDRRVELRLNPNELSDGCLLCSEALPHRCHRRLAAEYLAAKWGSVNIVHL